MNTHLKGGKEKLKFHNIGNIVVLEVILYIVIITENTVLIILTSEVWSNKGN